jgi:hypothetical protein
LLGGIVLVGIYLAGAIRLWQVKSCRLIFWIWIGLFWLPVANLWPLAYLAADRYLYTPLAGVVALTVLLFARLAETRRLSIAGLLIILLAGNAWLTWRQTDAWASDLTLWTHASQVNPLSSAAFINLSS